MGVTEGVIVIVGVFVRVIVGVIVMVGVLVRVIVGVGVGVTHTLGRLPSPVSVAVTAVGAESLWLA